jgi:hypothetical protein
MAEKVKLRLAGLLGHDVNEVVFVLVKEAMHLV